MLFVELVLNFLRVLEVVLISVFIFWVLPSIALLIRDEIKHTFSQFFEMREDNRANKRRHAQLIKDAQIRWEQKMGVKTNG